MLKMPLFLSNSCHFSVHKTEISKFLARMHMKYFQMGIFVIPGVCPIRKYGSQTIAFFLYFTASRGTVFQSCFNFDTSDDVISEGVFWQLLSSRTIETKLILISIGNIELYFFPIDIFFKGRMMCSSHFLYFLTKVVFRVIKSNQNWILSPWAEHHLQCNGNAHNFQEETG